MISIGNDIIALDLIDAGRTIQPVFYSRILDPSETGFFPGLSPLPFERYVWLLWSIKESVYKCIRRVQPELRFSPRKIIVKQIDWSSDTYRSLVYINSIPFYAQSRVNEKFISTLATNGTGFGNICWDIQQIGQTDPESQSQQVRRALLERLRSFFPNDRLQIERADAGYPVLVKNSSPTNLPISFSHHHNLVFYSFISPS
ncbi:MAG TPA: 4'-phosphopantetheinyl transferase superfamily protein [Puia sp.]|jgi:phosphopantetheinyl transferase (holo-ACP synthase)|nr:4'-phosphopantetheinyl transferase superfamily protein [Puia sp.]